MIKINLLKTIGEDSDIETLKINVSPVDLLIKFILLVLFVIPISYYESYNMNILKERNIKLKKKIKEFSSIIEEKKQNINEAEKVSERIDQLESKEEILMELAKKRSELIKILDHFQNAIPKKVWIRRISYDVNQIRIKGNSTDNENVSDFIRSLEEGAHLESVNLERSFYSKQGNLEVLDFELTCLLKES